jgi:glutathione S-transferase
MTDQPPLTLYFHPLSSFCQKVLIALYENATPFVPYIVDLSNEASRAAFLKVWPLGKFPVLHDAAQNRTIPESSIVIEYLAQYYRGSVRLVPDDADLARQVRMRDRFYDQYVQLPMQKIVGDNFRAEGQHDPVGVEQAKALLRSAYGLIEQDMAAKVWAMGDGFTMADCAAAPALLYANVVVPLGEDHPNTARYLRRLMDRPSYARVLREADPYIEHFPLKDVYRSAYGH